MNRPTHGRLSELTELLLHWINTFLDKFNHYQMEDFSTEQFPVVYKTTQFV
ncbi:hypothetical protein HanPSC8_Chr17g0750381 [Helianthus annuus]|nr:hypothetical protein HanPSC8_Chr17g0750381 [Helianthus annuus]